MPGGHSGLRQRSALEARQDQIAMRALHVVQHAEDVRLEFLEFGSFEDRPADADHAGS